jgi:hypothetical protein
MLETSHPATALKFQYLKVHALICLNGTGKTLSVSHTPVHCNAVPSCLAPETVRMPLYASTQDDYESHDPLDSLQRNTRFKGRSTALDTRNHQHVKNEGQKPLVLLSRIRPSLAMFSN